MRIYVETNFLVEMVFQQEQNTACEELLSLAGSRRIDLRIPAFSLPEPSYRIQGQARGRIKLLGEIEKAIDGLSRGSAFLTEAADLGKAALILSHSVEVEEERYSNFRTRLLDCSTVLPLSASVLREGMVAENEIPMSRPDAIVYASVLGDLRDNPAPSLFLNRNRKDFDIPDVVDALQRLNCELRYDFRGGLAEVRKGMT